MSSFFKVSEINLDFLNQIDKTDPIAIRQIIPLIQRHSSNLTNADNLYKNAAILLTPKTDLSNAESCQSMCENSAIKFVRVSSFSNIKNANRAFYNCAVEFIKLDQEHSFSAVDLSSVEYMNGTFANCSKLQKLELTVNIKDGICTSRMINAFYRMTSLSELYVYGKIKMDCDYNLLGDSIVTGIMGQPQIIEYAISTDSIQRFLNVLEDNTGESVQYTLSIPNAVYLLLSDSQKAIASNKNIQLKGV